MKKKNKDASSIRSSCNTKFLCVQCIM